MTPLLVLGVDPGERVTGFALVDSGNVIATWSSRTGKSVPPRVAAEAQQEYLERSLNTWKPQLVAIETYVYQGARSHSPVAFRLVALVERLVVIAEMHGGPNVVRVSKLQANASLGLRGKVSDARIKRALASATTGSVSNNAHERDAVLVASAGARMFARQLPRSRKDGR